MRKLTILVAMALMLAMAVALSGVGQAKPISDKADVQCKKLAMKTLGPSVNPSNYTFIGGTEDADNLEPLGTEDPNVFCGFGGDDIFSGELSAGDIFLGGAGNDGVNVNRGTFYGEAGDDSMGVNFGTFFGGAGDDHVNNNTSSGTFDGGAGTDSVSFNNGGILISVP